VEKTDFNGKHLDYLQLGWLVAWVLSEDSDYHGRKWTELDESITRDKFVSTLICYCRYEPTALAKSEIIVDTASFVDVLNGR
jgi:hypothetical protein